MSHLWDSDDSDDIDNAIKECNPQFTVSLHEFDKQNQIKMCMAGAGRGAIVRQPQPHYMTEVRTAANFQRMREHTCAMGHLPTTDEIMSTSDELDITATLRTLGICSQDYNLDLKTTRKNPEITEKVRMEGNFPILLDDEYFKFTPESEEPDKIIDHEEEERFNDENLPLHKRFPTIFKPKDTSNESSSTNETSTNETSATETTSTKDASKDSSTKKKKKRTKWRKLDESDTPNTSQTSSNSTRYAEPASVGLANEVDVGIYTPRDFYLMKGKLSKFSDRM